MATARTGVSQLRHLILLFAFIGSSNCAKIQFFDDVNHQGLFYEIDTSDLEPSYLGDVCENLPDYGRKILSSIKTNGECLMLYEDTTCSDYSFSSEHTLRVGPESETHHSDLSLFDFDNKAVSFGLCAGDKGGEKIHVELFAETEEDDLIFDHPNLCGCVTLPQSAINPKSVNNHGNCVKLFKEGNCQGESWMLVGGRSKYSQDLSETGFDVTKSIGLCSEGLRSSCLKMDADVFKFQVSFPEEGDPHEGSNPHNTRSVGDAPVSSQEIALAPPTVFSNKASSTSVVHEYSAQNTIRETVHIGRIPGLQSFSNVSVEEGLYVESNISSIGLFGRAKMTPILEAAYQYLDENSTDTFAYEEEQNVVVSQSINVAPCTQYQITSSVFVIHDHPMNYDIHVKLTAEYGGEPMTAAQIKKNLPEGFEFVEDLDEFSVVAKAGGKMTATFAHATMVNGDESEIEGCTRKENGGEATTSTPPAGGGDGKETVKETVWIYKESKVEIYIVLALALITTFGVCYIIFQLTTANKSTLLPPRYEREPSIRSLPRYWENPIANSNKTPVATEQG